MNLNVKYLVLVFALSALGTACKKDAPAGNNTRQEAVSANSEPASSPAKHASAHVTPGSHEDWCDEHRVPESQCAQCNPSLVAAFKATGDWCDEHGAPESQCHLCNPGLEIKRPPKPAGAK